MIVLDRRRLGLAAAAVIIISALVGGIAGRVGANHQFPDVATASAFHDAIGNFVDAGCATGFPDGTYRPTDAVNRQQLARFFNACGGRVEKDENFLTLTGTPQTLAEVVVEAGALGTGGGFVLAIAALEASTGTTGTPCEVHFGVGQTGGPAGGGEDAFIDLPNNQATEDGADGAVELIPVTAGDVVTYRVSANISANPVCTATVTGEASLTAIYLPFSGNGSGGESTPTQDAVEPDRG